MNAIIKYPGSKWSLANWIISFFPDHHSYVELFAGSLAVLFNKPRSNIETVNDLDGNVVNLFEWIKKDPERLAREIYYTPYARQIYENAYSIELENSFEKAVNFYILLNMGHGFRTTGEKVGWKNDVIGRGKAYAAREWCNLPDKIIAAAERLRGVQIENRPAVELLQKFNYPNVLFYLDPPYVLSSRRSKQKQYRYEMSDEDHEELLDGCNCHKGKIIISGRESKIYEDKLKHWHRVESFSLNQNAKKAKEILWMNFKPAVQMKLFN